MLILWQILEDASQVESPEDHRTAIPETLPVGAHSSEAGDFCDVAASAAHLRLPFVKHDTGQGIQRHAQQV